MFNLDMQIRNNTSTPAFQAGLTKKLKKEIVNCNPSAITDEFAKNGVKADFQNNKVVAWCSLKCLEIAKKLNLGLPAQVLVKDFSKMWNEEDEATLGLCTYTSSSLFNPRIMDTPAQTILFNSLIPWNKIDEISDKFYQDNVGATDSFMEAFIHEFSHVMHGNNLNKKLGNKKYELAVLRHMHPSYLKQFHIHYKELLTNISDYAATDPFEAVACDLSKRIIENLDKKTLTLKTDFINNSPYRKSAIFEINKDKDLLSKTLRKFWNGKF